MTVHCMAGGTAQSDRDALASGFALARALGTDMTVTAALPDAATALVYATSPYMVGLGAGAVEQVRDAQTELVSAWKTLYEAVAADNTDVVGSFNQRTGLTERTAAQLAVLADAVVFPRDAGRVGHTLSVAFESVLMDYRLPVVLAGTQPFEKGAAVVAWDGSPQAARALRLHLPLLKAATAVLIAQNPEDLKDNETGPFTPPDALISWLSHQGIVASALPVMGEIGEGLLDLCAAQRASVLVAGAYGHSRAGQFLFGGASRSFLRSAEAPALALCH